MAPLKDAERRDFLEICDDRYQRRSLILTSQIPLAHWHEQIGDPTVADSILDRLVHNAHRIWWGYGCSTGGVVSEQIASKGAGAGHASRARGVTSVINLDQGAT
jgi:hypothetical protein